MYVLGTVTIAMGTIIVLQLIGWRDVSRKLVLFITDAGFHFAGDGKVTML